MKYDSRLTIDLDFEEHAYLKMVSSHFQIPMRVFVLLSILEKICRIDDKLISNKANDLLSVFKKRNKL